jgi:hypothetical protein
MESRATVEIEVQVPKAVERALVESQVGTRLTVTAS